MTVTTSWDLFDDLHAAQDELQRFTAGRNRRPVQRDGASGATVWAPAVDIWERRNAYLVTAEIPGVSADDVEVTFDDGLLTIQGERHPRDGGERRAGPPVRAPARQVPPLHHVAQPRGSGQDRGVRAGRRATSVAGPPRPPGRSCATWRQGDSWLRDSPPDGRRAHHVYDDAAFDPSSAAATDEACIGRATGPVTAINSLSSLRGSEFEQRVTPSFGEVILRGVVDAYAVSA
jgi:hypothetical protein